MSKYEMWRVILFVYVFSLTLSIRWYAYEENKNVLKCSAR